MKVKSTEQSKTELRASIPGISEKYKRGVQDNSNWHDKASSPAAEDLYAQKVQEAIARKARQNAVAQTSQEEWKKASIDKGSQTIGTNLGKSVDKWGQKWGPYRETLASMELPARTADPTQNVMNRVVPIAQTLADKKKEMA